MTDCDDVGEPSFDDEASSRGVDPSADTLTGENGPSGPRGDAVATTFLLPSSMMAVVIVLDADGER